MHLGKALRARWCCRRRPDYYGWRFSRSAALLFAVTWTGPIINVLDSGKICIDLLRWGTSVGKYGSNDCTAERTMPDCAGNIFFHAVPGLKNGQGRCVGGWVDHHHPSQPLVSDEVARGSRASLGQLPWLPIGLALTLLQAEITGPSTAAVLLWRGSPCSARMFNILPSSPGLADSRYRCQPAVTYFRFWFGPGSHRLSNRLWRQAAAAGGLAGLLQALLSRLLAANLLRNHQGLNLQLRFHRRHGGDALAHAQRLGQPGAGTADLGSGLYRAVLQPASLSLPGPDLYRPSPESGKAQRVSGNPGSSRHSGHRLHDIGWIWRHADQHGFGGFDGAELFALGGRGCKRAHRRRRLDDDSHALANIPQYLAPDAGWLGAMVHCRSPVPACCWLPFATTMALRFMQLGWPVASCGFRIWRGA